MILFYLGIISLVIMVIYYFIRKDRLNDKKNLDNDWQKFLKSESLNDVKGIAFNGDKLIWNKYLLSAQLDKIIEVTNSRVEKFPELKKLVNNAYNKKLHYNRTILQSGSSGGIKQSG